MLKGGHKMVFVGGANISWACMLLNLGQVSAPLVKLQMAETETDTFFLEKLLDKRNVDFNRPLIIF